MAERPSADEDDGHKSHTQREKANVVSAQHMSLARAIEREAEASSSSALAEAARRLKHEQCHEALNALAQRSLSPAEYAQRALSGQLGSCNDARASARSASSALSRAISAHVAYRRHEMLERVHALASLRQDVHELHANSQPLLELANRTYDGACAPHFRVCSKASILRNIRSTAHALRECSKAVKLSLRAQSSELARSAHAAAQIFSLLDDENAGQLDGMMPADDAREQAQAAFKRVHAEAGQMLRRASESGSMAEASSAAQALRSVGPQVLHSALKSVASERAQSAAVCITSAASAATATATNPHSSSAQPSSTARSSDEAASQAIAVWRLQRALAKRRDSDGQHTLLDSLQEHGFTNPSSTFTDCLAKELRERSSNKVGSTGFVTAAKTIEAMVSRMHREGRASSVPAAAPEGVEAQLLNALAAAEHAYHEQCRRKLLDAADKATWAYSASKLVGKLHEEMHAASVHPRALACCAAACAAAIERFASRTESTIPSSSQIDQNSALDVLSQSESRSLALSCALQHASEAARSIRARVVGSAANANNTQHLFAANEDKETHENTSNADRLSLASEKASTAAATFVASVVRSWKWRVERCAEHSLHGTNDLERVLDALGDEVVPRVPKGKLGYSRIEDIARFTIRSWLRYVSLEQRLGHEQACDSALRLEQAISRSLLRVEALVPEGGMLRAFRHVVSATDPSAQSIRGADLKLPPSVALHLCFANAPDSLKAPHERAKLSKQQYSAWLDSHSNEDLWRSIQGAMESYKHTKQQNGEDVETDGVYNRLLELGQLLGLSSAAEHEPSTLSRMRKKQDAHAQHGSVEGPNVHANNTAEGGEEKQSEKRSKKVE